MSKQEDTVTSTSIPTSDDTNITVTGGEYRDWKMSFDGFSSWYGHG